MATFGNPINSPSESKSVLDLSKKKSVLVLQHIDAPLSVVWSIVRRFDKPQEYKPFAQGCSLLSGDGDVGSIREIHTLSSFPAKSSIERLDVLDDNLHVICFTVIGGDIGLNLHSTLLVVENSEEPNKSIVMEFLIADAFPGTTEEETRYIIKQLTEWNLLSLAKVAERIFRSRGSENE